MPVCWDLDALALIMSICYWSLFIFHNAINFQSHLRKCIANALSSLGGDLEVVHSLLLSPFLRLVVLDLTIWKITLVADQALYHWGIDAVIHDLVPLLKIFE